MVIDTAPESLRKLQTGFAAHIRDPQKSPAPDGIEDRRMAIYRELFFNNIRSFLSTNFPVLHSLYDAAGWDTLCRDFYRDFQCQAPLFPEIPREFLRYLQEGRGDRADDPPFMLELAHYEWVELALSIAETEAEASAAIATDGDLLQGCPLLSPLAWALCYSFPVHRIGPDFQPQVPDDQPTYLLVYRNADDDVVFIELNPVSARLFALLQDNPNLSGLQALQQISAELAHPDPDVVIAGGLQILEQWRQRGIVLGPRH